MYLGSRIMLLSGSFAEDQGVFQAWLFLLIVNQKVNDRIALVGNPEVKPSLGRWPLCKGVKQILSCQAPLHSRSRGLPVGGGGWGKDRQATGEGSWVQTGPHNLWVGVLSCGFLQHQAWSESQNMSGGPVDGSARERSEWGPSRTSPGPGKFWAGRFGRTTCNPLVRLGWDSWLRKYGKTPDVSHQYLEGGGKSFVKEKKKKTQSPKKCFYCINVSKMLWNQLPSKHSVLPKIAKKQTRVIQFFHLGKKKHCFSSTLRFSLWSRALFLLEEGAESGFAAGPSSHLAGAPGWRLLWGQTMSKQLQLSQRAENVGEANLATQLRRRVSHRLDFRPGPALV